MRGPPTTYMILEADTLDGLLVAFDKIGLAAALERSRSLALKVNLARPPDPGQPRSDSCLMKAVARYAGSLGVPCTIIEAADGHLEENLRCIGLGRWLDEGMVSCLDSMKLWSSRSQRRTDRYTTCPRVCGISIFGWLCLLPRCVWGWSSPIT